MFYIIVCILVWPKSLKSIGQLFAREHVTICSYSSIIFLSSLSLPKTYSSQLRTSISGKRNSPKLLFEPPKCKVSPEFAHLASLLDQTSQLPPETLARLLCSQHYLSFNNDVRLWYQTENSCTCALLEWADSFPAVVDQSFAVQHNVKSQWT